MKKTAGVSILIVGLSLAAWRTPADQPRAQEPVLPAPPTQQPRPAPDIELPPGFVAELVYEVPQANGSWVALAVDPQGRIYAAGQNRGLYRVTPAALGDRRASTSVEVVDLNVRGAHGLLWAFDSLYVTSNGRDSGLYRARDTDGDDQLDDMELLRSLRGSGEHGPHTTVPTPDGQGLYVLAGNHTDLTEIDGSRTPPNWDEDLLLPRMWDAKGHARGRLAPGAWICRIDPQGETWELVSNGYRNPFDLAVNPEGELFTYDADMEWDLGMPWYRPTRVCHVTSGSEFGWRSGSGKWPVTYPDSLPPVVEIGPGSPTAMVFGTGLNFPTRYQQTLFLLDWTFGTMHAVQLEPDGATYRGEVKEFLSGQPLPLADAVVGHDGALYFVVGGRGIQSALFRVAYTGDESTATPAPMVGGESDRSVRHELEGFHGQRDPRAVAEAWPRLNHEDRFVRFAARLAVEAQPVERWANRALRERRPWGAITALLALVRQGEAEWRDPLIRALGNFDFAELSEEQQVAVCRVYALCFVRMGEVVPEERRLALEQLDPLYPSGRGDVDAELAQLLVYLDAPTVVDRTLELLSSAEAPELPDWGDLIARNDSYGGTISRMLADMPPTRKIHYAFALRNVRYGWTLAQRRQYFEFFREAAEHPGGESYAGFLENIREAALENCSTAERNAVADLTGGDLVPDRGFDITPPRGPGRLWNVAEALAVVGEELRGRSFTSGRNLYYATSCAACHRFDGAGGNTGPDLSTVVNKFSMPDLLEAILEPSAVISDQFSSSIVVATDGRVATGIVVERDATIEVYTSDPEAPPVVITRNAVRSVFSSSTSQMTEGLVNLLSAEELRDLLAYLLSRGDPQAAVFRVP